MPTTTTRRAAAWLTAVLTALVAPLALAVPAEAASAWPTEQDSSPRSANVMALQYLLTARGISTAADGDFGAGTLANVKTFQSRNGLTADGIVGPATWSKLVVTLSQGATNTNAVKALQTALNKYRYGLVVDGAFGSGTRSAVVAFQQARGLAADGVAGQNTWRELLGYSRTHDQIYCYYYGGTTSTTVTTAQVENAKSIIAAGKSVGVPRDGLIVGLMAAMQESKLCNISFGDRDSIGLFQQRPSQGWCNNQVGCWHHTQSSLGFFGRSSYTNNRGLLDIANWQSMSKTLAADAVQRSCCPNAYAKWEALATALVNAHG
ncbi:peptidoglycan-binding domain-containing protein [Nocardioides speluncae]|uniref:peptidoglycan-binding domain-containing protein n=1 Tax=Nocardioides speluncae TaxID=2670337 RepID=UPI000D68BF8E|nr:peptidoglycan-binding protein [Nocardioides speluncae]